MTNYDAVLEQLRGVGLLVHDLEFGRIIRCPVEGRKGKAGWYALHLVRARSGEEIIVGSFGVWQGADKTTHRIELDDRKALGPAEREALKKRYAEDRRHADLIRKKAAGKAAQVAARVWAKYLPSGDSDYLRDKGVGGHGVRYTSAGSVVIPVVNAAGVIQGLQIIRSAAVAKTARKPAKEFWPVGMQKQGHFHLIGVPRDIILVAEGYATAATLHEATQFPVAVAFDCGNLVHVGRALRKRYKHARLVFCADDDAWTDGNPGVSHAQSAALETGSAWLVPTWPDKAEREAARDRGDRWTDFNDLVNSPGGTHGMVAAGIEALLKVKGWLSPSRSRAALPAPGGGGEREALRPIDDLDHMIERFALVYAHQGTAFDHQERVLAKLTDVRDACQRSELFKAWTEHPDRQIVRVDEVGFDPTERDPNIRCNLWSGWPTTPKKGECGHLIDLLAHMCGGDHDQLGLMIWVLRWLAYPLQNPGAKMKTCIVIHGPQGTGKNLFFESVMKIYGRYGRVVGQDQIEDKYNGWASRLLFLVADEVVARSDLYQVKNKLKSLITGDWIEINQKHVASYPERNHVNMVFLSNETLPVVLEEDDRRHAVIWTPEKLGPEFYDKVLDEIASGGVEALHDQLLNLDLGDFHPGTPPPDTSARRDLIDQSRDSTTRFFYELVTDDIEGVTAMPALSKDVYRLYQTWCHRKGQRAAPEPRLIAALTKRHKVDNARERYLDFSHGRPQEDALPKGPHGRLLLGPLGPDGKMRVPECPDGVTRRFWLGGCYSAFANAVSDYRGGRDDH